jgi:hypothetical protein
MTHKLGERKKQLQRKVEGGIHNFISTEIVVFSKVVRPR